MRWHAREAVTASGRCPSSQVCAATTPVRALWTRILLIAASGVFLPIMMTGEYCDAALRSQPPPVTTGGLIRFHSSLHAFDICSTVSARE